MIEQKYSYDEYKDTIYKKIRKIKNIIYGYQILPYYPRITNKIKYKWIGEITFIENLKMKENEKLVLYNEIIHEYELLSN